MQTTLFKSNKDYEFIGKSLYLPKLNILAVGDMHLGYEFMLKEAGSMLPQTQIKQTIEELKEILEILKKRKINLEKIIFLGDIKHYFAYKKQEKNILIEVINTVKKYIDEKNIILIKGNHEKVYELADKEFINHYVYKDTIFIHGDVIFPELKDKKIKKVVMAHLHPAVRITDNQGIRSEKYKCFLIGKYKNKEIFILPSFFPLIEGSSINEHLSETSCIIPPNYLYDFNVYAIGEKNSIFEFGKLKSLRIKD